MNLQKSKQFRIVLAQVLDLQTNVLVLRVKICCIASPEEAQMAIQYGASAIGLVGKMPSGPGPIPDDRIRKIASQIPPPIATFLLTSETEPQAVVDHAMRAQTNTIQIVDQPGPGTYELIRKKMPNIRIVQVIHVIDTSSVDYALSVEPSVDALLLDSGKPGLPVKELGGTGRTHDWRISKRIVDEVSIPVFLAGGIRPQNVVRAVETVRPFGIDLCSGVRTAGKLDKLKLAAFFAEIRKVL